MRKLIGFIVCLLVVSCQETVQQKHKAAVKPLSAPAATGYPWLKGHIKSVEEVFCHRADTMRVWSFRYDRNGNRVLRDHRNRSWDMEAPERDTITYYGWKDTFLFDENNNMLEYSRLYHETGLWTRLVGDSARWDMVEERDDEGRLVALREWEVINGSRGLYRTNLYDYEGRSIGDTIYFSGLSKAVTSIVYRPSGKTENYVKYDKQGTISERRVNTTDTINYRAILTERDSSARGVYRSRTVTRFNADMLPQEKKRTACGDTADIWERTVYRYDEDGNEIERKEYKSGEYSYVTTTTTTYNKQGQKTESVAISRSSDESDVITRTERKLYPKYDEKGNSLLEMKITTEPCSEPDTFYTYRTIEYYD